MTTDYNEVNLKRITEAYRSVERAISNIGQTLLQINTKIENT